ncbi:ligand-binding sensor domain-containing protein [Adhaeribacter pallidiroseus]|uniref:Putative sensor-like histidine kinase n=1 Tax=Adhaeribacter pallidiroseus TaxID=2072847 RepID=A0A369QMH7_9BACT|nr:sensor histidine kinase [Adhaeribacter pallidiroseus]RDC64059.1 putative sensor-like histidine kinase [Adhaeribacter pallidiroseus]
MLAFTRFIGIVIICFFNFQAWAQHVYRNYLNEEGSSNATIYHVLPDSKGFIWFGTEYGVIRFDGKNYLKLTVSDGLSDNEVLKIQEDSKGRIWFLTFNGRLSYYYNGKIFNEDNNPVLKKAGALATLNSFYEDQSGNLWFSGYYNQILKISPTNQVQKFDLGNQKRIPEIGKGTFFYEDKSGELLIVSAKNFYTFRSNYEIKPRFFKFKIQGLKTYYSNKPNYLLFLSKAGLVEMQDTVQRLLIPANQLPTLTQLNTIFVDKNQSLWLNSLGDGVYQIKNFRTNPEPYQHFLSGKIITWIDQDKENNLWFTSAEEGVYMLPGNHLEFSSFSYTQKEGLTSNNIFSITKDRKNHIWLGLGNGLINQITPTGIKKYNINFRKAPYNRVLDLFVDNKNVIWGATDMGAAKLVPRKKGKYRVHNMLYHNDARPYAVKSIAQAPSGKMTFVHAAGIEAFRKTIDPKNPYWVAPIAGVTRNRTYTHFYDHAGTLWFANLNGLQKYINPGTIINYGINHSLLSRRITDISEMPDGSLVLATYGYGLIVFNKDRITHHITKKNGLAEDICKKIFVRGSTVWVATTTGLSKIVFKNGAIAETRNYYSTDGLLSNGINDIYADAQGVYIATSKGLSILKDRNQQMLTTPPPVYITQVIAGKKDVTGITGSKLNHRQNRFIFNFIAITYQDPENVNYEYRLHGVNSSWITTANNTVEFSSLAPGKYVFEVKAKKRNSHWSKPIRFSFTVAPPFWQTWWFIAVAIVGVLGTVFLISWYFLQQKLKAKIRQLETEHKIQLERERIARDLHDNVGSHLTYIVNRLDDSPHFAQAPEQLNQMEQLRDFTRQTITQLRETIWAIRKENVAVGELNAKLQKLLWQMVPPNGPLTYQFKSSANETILLTSVQTLNIFRIAQEALTNILKHSRATFVTVYVSTVADKYLQLLLQDNGIGFEPSGVNLADHYGLTNMHERAAELKTTLEVKSEKGKGTQVILLVNLTDAAPPAAAPLTIQSTPVHTHTL